MTDPVTIVVQDGSSPSGANSYGDVAGVRLYATQRGVALSVDDNIIGSQLILAMDLIESYRARFKGQKTDGDQPTQWPRTIPVSLQSFDDFTAETITEVRIDDQNIADDVIPITLIAAQYQLVIEQANGIKIIASSNPNRTLKEQKIGPITQVFFAADTQPSMPAFDNLMAPLLNNGGAFALSTTRV